MPQAYQASAAAVALPLEALSPAEPWHSSMGPSIWFTVAALLVYRLGTYIPIPGIDVVAFRETFIQQYSGIPGMFNMLAGGAVERMAIFALNIVPYISALIIMQLATSLMPGALQHHGEQERKRINQYTRYLTVALAAFQAYSLACWLEDADAVVIEPGRFFRICTIATMVGGTTFLMWLGEQITARGVGNGPSLIIMSGIVAELPRAVAGTLELGRQGALSTRLILAGSVMTVAVIAFIVFTEGAQRRLLIQYPRRRAGNPDVFEGQSPHLSLKLNISGVIPPVFAISLLLLPITVANFKAGQIPDWLVAVTAQLGRGRPLFLVFYAALIIFFAFLYTAIVFNPTETADNLKKHGGFIPGIRPGERTAEYIDYVQSRITMIGAIYVAAACVLLELVILYTGVLLLYDASALFIVVVGMLELKDTLFRFST